MAGDDYRNIPGSFPLPVVIFYHPAVASAAPILPTVLRRSCPTVPLPLSAPLVSLPGCQAIRFCQLPQHRISPMPANWWYSLPPLWGLRRILTFAASNTASIATPIFSTPKVFSPSAYETPAAGCSVCAPRTAKWRTQESLLHPRHAESPWRRAARGRLPIGFNNTILTCLEFNTGKVMWRHRSVGKGSLTYADGHLYLLGEDFVVGLVERRRPDTRKRDVSRFAMRGCRRGPPPS